MDLLEEEQKNLLKHLELQLPDNLSALKQLVSGIEQEKDLISQFKIQEENFFVTVRLLQEKFQNCLNQKDEKIAMLETEIGILEENIIPQSQEASQVFDV